ncbi:hypothetical protein K3165_09450 [Qipengyuania sp. 1XM1-15A]|uniref:hypothetical protein n=1 Tax=Qipengyuania xiamenensis TaxID=2867237 RepID=UPI001C888E3B|nr:hypothetical protein [Qipengyuania xiamenensis]MBX7533144.1 hypothetical protein [Qipengyuania xiamenensis]
MKFKLIAAGASALALAACGGGETEPEAPTTDEMVAIPDSLAPFGEGYPNAGDPCRNLGESAATSNYLDDSAMLVGCPNQASAEALGGTIVDTVDGVRLVSVPMGDANAGMGENGPVEPAYGEGDATVAGTDYNATTMLSCGFDNGPPTQTCDAGVKRNWGEDGTHLVEVTKPDGRKRAIFFNGTTPYGADSAQADGSAGWDLTSTRDGDQVTIRFGPETYVVVDALITGG